MANSLSTYRPVGDATAERFAETFYTALLGGQPIGQALLAGRGKVRELKSVDWIDYIPYCSYDFTLKQA